MMRLNSRTTVPVLSATALLALAGCPGGENIDAGGPPDAFVLPPTEPELTITPALQDFGDVVVDDMSMPTTFTVENTGDGQSASLSAILDGAGAV